MPLLDEIGCVPTKKYYLVDKRVGIIGTGATAVQITPRLSKWAKELFALQQTPSSINVCNSKPTDAEWVHSLRKGQQRKHMNNFNILVYGGKQNEDMIQDGWTNIFKRGTMNAANDYSGDDSPGLDAQAKLAGFRMMEANRFQITQVVRGPEIAEKLKPWHNQLCKRLCFHDEYLKTLNLPNARLIDTMGKGISKVSKGGIVANGKGYPLECIIYAIGFNLASIWTERSSIEVYGRGWCTLTEKWSSIQS
ncbi:uncharacterized protein NECHADRAFT_79806 [Fusarium vanettenii 77-13-4]|uniref:Uncharacterized protein n=1 Tax=Fusarium vanettenii (strain ATCC MYA-4622 / CBS 123669 / FGSC 9596 / NRRL 45880 / 77-13-4) TaxID=660122 RepID=C7ZM59_FUSV7|nr:uncharacterized protein NECHADRAFT_79806 [Fusarium vanettenii 77-13-4]EEU34909.1 hypothetical protein NECHADRAFT_79806 [Fusarium vanettenii 77-13-4]